MLLVLVLVLVEEGLLPTRKPQEGYALGGGQQGRCKKGQGKEGRGGKLGRGCRGQCAQSGGHAGTNTTGGGAARGGGGGELQQPPPPNAQPEDAHGQGVAQAHVQRTQG